MRPRRTPSASPLPLWAGGLGALALCFLTLPLAFMLGRVEWAALASTLATDEASSALALSLRTCGVALGVDLLLGVPAALLLSRSWRGVRAARILVALPLSLPPVVAGIALLSAFGRRSTLGALLTGAGLDIAFTTTAVVIAQVFVSLPFLIVTLESALRAREPGFDEMASSLGASPTRVFWQITLPTVLPGLGRGAALALARCLGEFGATLTFAGSMQGVTRTMPLQIYLARESDAALALALGVVLLGVAALVVALTETPWGHLAALVRSRLSSTRPGLVRAHLPASGAGPGPTDEPLSAGGGHGLVPTGSETAGSSPSGAPVHVDGSVCERGWAVDARLRPGLVTAVVGHNGAGKSTLAQVVAGTLRLDSGSARIGERVVDDAATFVPARRRGVAMVSQAPRIFTHMSVLANVAFPLRVRGVGRAEARAAALEQLRAVGIADLAHRRGSDLSGGQAARVALARALVFRPDVLILDEPTAALDVEATAQVSAVLRERLAGAGITTLLVSHDIAEVLALASRMIVMGEGRVVEEGEPARVLASPSSVFAARLAGLNIVTGSAVARPGLVGVRVGEGVLWAADSGPGAALADAADRGGARCADDSVSTPPSAASGEAPGAGGGSGVGGADAAPGADAGSPEPLPSSPAGEPARVALTFPPEAVALSREEAHASPRSVLSGVVEGIDVNGSLVSVRVALAEDVVVTARVTASAWADLGLGVGDPLWASVKATQVRAITVAVGS